MSARLVRHGHLQDHYPASPRIVSAPSRMAVMKPACQRLEATGEHSAGLTPGPVNVYCVIRDLSLYGGNVYTMVLLDKACLDCQDGDDMYRVSPIPGQCCRASAYVETRVLHHLKPVCPRI